MRSAVRVQTGETQLDHMQPLGSGDIEPVMTDLVTPDRVLWRGGADISAASAPNEDPRYLTHHRVFACLSGNCGLQKITLETES
jgi:hypothetical protein